MQDRFSNANIFLISIFVIVFDFNFVLNGRQ